MPKYMLILRDDITKDLSGIGPEQFGEILAAYEAWGAKLQKSGNMSYGRKLQSEGGRVLKPDATGKKATAKDGPYVETKEVVGGIYVISARDYDHAVQLCQGHPHFRFGSIEVREVDFMGGPEE